MSNGLMDKFQDIVETGEIPQEVSNGLLMAGVIDNSKRLTKVEKNTVSKKDLETLEKRVKTQEDSSKRWNRLVLLIATIVTGIGTLLGRE